MKLNLSSLKSPESTGETKKSKSRMKMLSSIPFTPKSVIKKSTIAQGLVPRPKQQEGYDSDAKSSKQRSQRTLTTRDGSNQSITKTDSNSSLMSEAESVDSVSIRALMENLDDTSINLTELEKKEERNSAGNNNSSPSNVVGRTESGKQNASSETLDTFQSSSSMKSFRSPGSGRREQFASSKNFQSSPSMKSFRSPGSGRREQFASSKNFQSSSSMRSFRSPGTGRREQFASSNTNPISASARSFRSPGSGRREQLSSTKNNSSSMRMMRSFDRSPSSFHERQDPSQYRCNSLQRVTHGSGHNRTLPRQAASMRSMRTIDRDSSSMRSMRPSDRDSSSIRSMRTPDRDSSSTRSMRTSDRGFHMGQHRYSSSRNIGKSVPQSTFDQFSASLPVFNQESTADLYPELYSIKRNPNDVEVGAELARAVGSSGRRKRRSAVVERGDKKPTANSGAAEQGDQKSKENSAPVEQVDQQPIEKSAPVDQVDQKSIEKSAPVEQGDQPAADVAKQDTPTALPDQQPTENSADLPECRSWVLCEDQPSWLQ